MSNLSITEYSYIGLDRAGSPIGGGLEPAVNIQNVQFSSVEGVSDSFDKSTTMVRVISNVDCRVVFGSDPKATQGSTLLNVGVAEYFGVSPRIKLSVVEV
jgi:hypothetical protein